MIPTHELRDFFVANGAEVVHDGADCVPTIAGFAHYEDATPGSISWLRHPPQTSYNGTVLLLQCHYEHESRAASHMLVVHPNMRALVGKIVRKFFVHHGQATIAPTARVHPTVIVGADAQNYEWIANRWSAFPACGGVRIAAGTEIGPYATIVRGSVGDTTIGEGCRIGQHVNVGHDCRVGDHTLIIAHASLAGWVRVGKHCKIYQGAVVKNGVQIGDNAVIGMGAVVIADVGPGEIWVGSPARRVGHR